MSTGTKLEKEYNKYGTEEIEADTEEKLIDDGYESAGYVGSTSSLRSAVGKYVCDNGRFYHAYFGEDKNLMPVDEPEQDRLDLQHEILLQLMNGRLHLAPIDTSNPQRILDLGTGTGIWAIDIADSYPSAEVIGVDLSPIQPQWVPPNCRFEVDDIELPWTYQANSFDFIHSRNLEDCIKDWPSLMSSIHRCLSPGGYFELVETTPDALCDDRTLPSDCSLRKALDYYQEGMKSAGRGNFVTPTILRERLEAAGFESVQVVTVKQPIGSWPKERRLKRIGALARLVYTAGLEAYANAVMKRFLKVEADIVDGLVKGAIEDLKNNRYHTYNYLHIAYGRKPKLGE